MIRFLFKTDRQTGAETWGSFWQSVDLDLPALEKLLAEGWTFQGIEVRGNAPEEPKPSPEGERHGE